MNRRNLLKAFGGIGAATAFSTPATAALSNTDPAPWVEWREEQEHTTVEVDRHELDMAFIDRGSGDPPVFFLHGIPTWSFIWRDVIQAVSDERRVIVPDMVGYGESSQFDGFDRSIRANEEAFGSLLKNLGYNGNQPIDLVGHDLGGGVFLRYAAHHPDKVRKLVLTNSVQYNSWALEPVTDFSIPTNVQDITNEQFAEILEDFYQLGLYAGESTGDALEEFIRDGEGSFETQAFTGTNDTADATDDAEYEWRYGEEVLIGPDLDTETIENEEFIKGTAHPYVRRGDLGRISTARNAHATNTSHTTEIDPSEITAETLLLWGADDFFQPIKWAHKLEDDIKDAEVIPIDEARHWAMEDRPEKYRFELRKFLL